MSRRVRSGPSWPAPDNRRGRSRVDREPYALALSGDFRGAADLWGALEFPFEHALELADVGEPEAAAEAIAILERLGAGSAAQRVRDRAQGLSA